MRVKEREKRTEREDRKVDTENKQTIREEDRGGGLDSKRWETKDTKNRNKVEKRMFMYKSKKRIKKRSTEEIKHTN